MGCCGSLALRHGCMPHVTAVFLWAYVVVAACCGIILPQAVPFRMAQRVFWPVIWAWLFESCMAAADNWCQAAFIMRIVPHSCAAVALANMKVPPIVRCRQSGAPLTRLASARKPRLYTCALSLLATQGSQ